jgi:peptidoglycan/xylan/chitin deacetylase (PgdA/CDA1 family)
MARWQKLLRTTTLALVALTNVISFGQSNPSAQTHAIALTFDDLPYLEVGAADYVSRATRVTDTILRVLQAHHAPAVAFVNETRLNVEGERNARVAVLRRWADAGVMLGNHTYSHQDFNAVSVEQFEDEIVRGEVVTRQLMEPHRPYQLYFRHPQTHTGDTLEKKQAVEAFVAARGYKITPHTIDNSDFVFNAPYARASASDTETRTRLLQAYFDFTVATSRFAEHIAPAIFGRDIPQTILLHACDITADSLDRILNNFEARAYRFISLDEAMADPAYQTPDTFVTKFGPTWLWRWTKSKGVKVSFKDDPEPPTWVAELYSKH